MADFDYAKYFLPEVESREIFTKAIAPDHIDSKAEATAKPVATFVAGQPGAGKTALTARVAQGYRSAGGVVQINSDTYKPYHPRWEILLEEDDQLAAPYTMLDGRRWMRMAEEYASSKRMNILIETTMRGPDVFDEPMSRLASQGYAIELAVVATPEALSRLGILARYQEMVRSTGFGRLTETRNHDECYAAIGQKLLEQDRRPAVDLISIWRRDGELIYMNEASSGKWERPAHAADSLASERQRALPLPIAQAALQELDLLRKTLPSELRAQCQAIDVLLEPLLPTGARSIDLIDRTLQPFSLGTAKNGKPNIEAQEMPGGHSKRLGR